MKKGSKAAEPDTNGIAPGAARADARRKYDPEQTKRNILDVATQEFSAMGLTGARVDAIAERTNTTKRMLYYYFGSKQGLYLAVLERASLDPAGQQALLERLLAGENVDEPIVLSTCNRVEIYVDTERFHDGIEVATTDGDRAQATPWNTYVRPGLPATPICSPGAPALLAAEQPELVAVLTAHSSLTRAA